MTEEQVFDAIRANIRASIARSGYPSVERFAYSNDLDKSFLSRILNGSREPKFSSLLRIAAALEISLAELVGMDVMSYGRTQSAAADPGSGRKYRTGRSKKD